MPQQITIDKFCQPSPGPKPTTSLRRSAAGGEATPTPGSRPPLSLPSTSTPTGTDNPGSTGVSTPAETSNARPTAAPSPSESSTIPSPNAGTGASPRPPTVAPPMASTSNLRAGSRSAPKRKRRQPGSPSGLGSPTPRRKQKRENSAENNDDTLQEITNLMPEGQQSTVNVGANCPPGSSTPAEAGAGSAHPATDQPAASPATGVTTGSASPARSCGLENDESLQEITNKSKQNDRSADVPEEEGQQSAVDVGANCPPGSSTPAEAGTGSAHPTTDQSEALPSTGVTTGSPSPARSCELENDESLQVTSKKKCKKEFPGEKEKEIAEIMFRLKVNETGLNEVFEIRAPANQPILTALQADTRLEKIKKRLPKIYLNPYGENNPIRGVPNIGSPCSVIEGGTFEAEFHGKAHGLNKYSDDQLKTAGRSKIYLDVRIRKNKTKWLTEENPNFKIFHFPMLIDCLPDDTLLSALHRDARIRNDRLKSTKLCTSEINIKLTDKSSFHHDKTFTYQVLQVPQISDEDWEKASPVQNHKDGIPQTTTSSPDVAMSGAKVGNGTPGLQPDIATPGADKDSGSLQTQLVPEEFKRIIRRSKTLVAELLKFDFKEKKSERAERKRKRHLEESVKTYRQDFYNRFPNQGISGLLMEKCYEFLPSVGILVKNGHPCGTCFRLGSKYVMTNGHVTEMAGLEDASNAFVNFNYTRSSDFDFNQQSSAEPDLFKFRVLRVVASSEDYELDYSLLELGVPDDQSGRLPPGLGHLIQPTSQGKFVTIIGHPGGGPKWVDTSCPVVGPNHSIAVYLKFHPEGSLDPMLNNPKRENYLSGFGPGASGSPGFDEDGNLFVMHSCGYHLYDGSKTEVEQGVRMTAMKEDLQQRDDLPAGLWEDLFLPPPESMEVE